jgi:hypothetical protein
MQNKLALTIIALLTAPLATATVADEIQFTLREPYGIMRHGIPVGELVTLPAAVPDSTPFRLMREGKPVRAQFRNTTPGKESAQWWLDFAGVLDPFETAAFTIQYGPKTKPGPERERGHVLIENEDAYTIANAPYIVWKVPRDLSGLLESVSYPPLEHLQPAEGLMIRDAQGNQHRLGGAGTKSRVLRQGPMTVGLRFEKTETAPELAGVHWTVDLVFPARVSWMEVDLHVDDPLQHVAALGWQLHVNLDPPSAKDPTLVDFGASRTVYGSLRPDWQMELRARPSLDIPWQVWRGQKGELRLMEAAPLKSAARPEGWAHVMDRRRCLALAVSEFAKQGDEQLTVDADGTLSAWRTFAAEVGREKMMQSWFHFVTFPHQLGAATSPQSMQTPLELRWVAP